jgi:hypothetical protein
VIIYSKDEMGNKELITEINESYEASHNCFNSNNLTI